MIKPYYRDNHDTLYYMDFRENDLPDESVQMVCTSPPYWGLRKYSGERDLIWLNGKNCRHDWITKEHRDTRGIEGSNLTGRIPYKEGEARINYTDGFCSICGAWRGAYGLEPTPEMYVQHTIEILREIRRVLRKDGVVFWNIGDSYWGGGQGGNTWGGAKEIIGVEDYGHTAKGKHSTLKPKDLCLIPFRVAIAAQEDGWYVRSDIIWSKPNPMPESVTDRPTNSHEHILMLTKSAKYYWDADAVREPQVEYGRLRRLREKDQGLDSVYSIASEGKIGQSPQGATGAVKNVKARHDLAEKGNRNIRSVWEFPTQSYPEAHFAVFPEKLPELCIKAATPEVGCCSKCGSPWSRVLDKKPSAFNIRVRDAKAGRATAEEGYKATQEEMDNYQGNHPDPGYRSTLGWQPTCKCNAGKTPSLVLDPFAGAGTTLWVAKKLNRKAVGFDTSEEYCQLAMERLRQQVML